mgnify:CR=1 FL=1
MTIKEKTIRELESLDTDKIRIVYDIIRTLKRSPGEKSESMKNVQMVRDALKNVSGSMSDDIIKDRLERI